MEAPERIYLQGLRNDDGEWIDWHTCMGDEVSWCERRINDYDVEYVRRDVAAKLWEATRNYYFGAPWPHSGIWKLLAETVWLEER